ncbi:MAG: hypothetical protein N2662_04930 [Bacteroidales bacterium]|nr:hypothetical protein [Bacteroidales bacterium]
MGSNITIVFLSDDNSDDEGSSQMQEKLLEIQVNSLIQELHIDETPVPHRLTERVLQLCKI